MRRITLTLFAISILFLSACTPKPEAAATATPTPAPSFVAVQAGRALEGVQSLRFIFETSGAPVYVDAEETLAFRRAEGDYTAPDRMQGSAKILAGGFVAEVQVVAIGERKWMTNLLTGEWEKLPPTWGLNPATFFDATAGIPYILIDELEAEQLEGPLEREDIRGEVWHLTGRLDGQAVETMSGGLIPPGLVELEAWIDPLDYEIRRLLLVLPETDPVEPTEWLIEFSISEEPIDISPPE